MNFLNTILDFIFPPRCLGCKRLGRYVCNKCMETVRYSHQRPDENCISILEYRQSIVKDAIWLLKYKGKRPVGTILARLVYDGLLEELSEMHMMENFSDPILIPIPLSKSKCRERGYNQADIIGRELARLDGNTSFSYDPRILIKTKDTRSQAKMHDRESRLRNLRGCFRVTDPDKIKNRNIIILDDITTTGATLHEASAILMKAGAKRVLAVAVAH